MSEPQKLPTLEDMERLVTAEDLTGPLKMPLHGVYGFLKTVPPGIVVRLGRRVRVKEAKLIQWIEAGCPTTQSA